jgi:surface antigen
MLARMLRPGRSLRVLACLAAFASAAPLALGQGVAWLRGTEGLTKEDVELHWAALQAACEEAGDRETRSWSNDRTGARGSVTPVESFEHEGQRCRLVVTRVQVKQTRRAKHRVCRQPDGVWRLLD